MKAREEGGPFTSLYDFCVRVDRTRINKRTVEALIKAGAFDSLQLNRASLIASVDRAFDFANAAEANANQGGLFDMGDSHAASTQEPPLVEATPWGVKERLTLREDGGRLLPVGAPVRRSGAGGAAFRASARSTT